MFVSLDTPDTLSAAIEELTTGTPDGTGVFDALMRAMRSQLDTEYTNGRIRGPEYAKVFTEALGVCAQVGVQYALARVKASHEVAILQQQLLNLQEELLNTQASRARTDAETDRANAEILLLDQKKTTELAQVNATGVNPNSVIGSQLTLYQNQANSFIRDAEQKAAEILTKTWSVAAANGEAIMSPENRLGEVFIGDAIRILLEGVGSDVDALDAEAAP